MGPPGGAAGLGPEEPFVISFDNSSFAWWLSPERTNIGLLCNAMGSQAVELLLRPSSVNSLERVPMSLHTSESIALVGLNASWPQSI
jgi:DNA-binding LacI/PurR family transcriptional regulator